jgi:hypothetical protein
VDLSPVGGFLRQLVAYGDLEFFTQKSFVDTSADFLYGKKVMALYVKRLFPYKKVCAQG